MAQNTFIVRCSQCRAKNRIPLSRISEHPVCGKCRAALQVTARFPEKAIDAEERSFGDEVLRFPGSVLVLFWAPWCGHCRRLLPIFEELASQYAGSIKFVKVELDKNPSLASQYQVQSVPVLLLFKKGQIRNRLLGALPKDQIEYHLRSLL
ncbi:MAG: thioredoxin [Syntrophobacteraceae bacterium]